MRPEGLAGLCVAVRRFLEMVLEVEVRAVRQAVELLPAERIIKFKINRALGVMRAVALADLRFMHARGVNADLADPFVHLLPPPIKIILPILVARGRRDEIFNLHLLEFARAEDEIARRDLVAERLPDLRDAEGQLPPRRVQNIFEVDEDPLRRLRPEVCDVRLFLGGPHERLEHQIEKPRLGE